MNSTGFLTACICRVAGLSASLSCLIDGGQVTTQKSRPLAEDRLFAVFSGESSLFKGDGSRQRTTYCCRDSATSENRCKFYLTFSREFHHFTPESKRPLVTGTPARG